MEQLPENKIVIADMHTHSFHSHDSECTIEEMAKVQEQKGVSIFAVTDHCDIRYFETMDLEKLTNESIKDAQNHNDKFCNIEILRGVEIGDAIWNREATKKIEKIDCDVIIGSVHAVRYPDYQGYYALNDFAEMDIFSIKQWLDKYFADMLETIEKCDFDILAHLTCPLRYINGKYNRGIDIREYKEKIEVILRAIISKNIALEINTSCKGGNYDEFMPEEWIVELYKKMGGYLVTLGSDAHKSENAAQYFDQAIAMLKTYGFENIYYLKNRKFIPIEI